MAGLLLILQKADNSNKEQHLRCVQFWVRSTIGKPLSGSTSILNHDTLLVYSLRSLTETPYQRTHGYADDTQIYLCFQAHSPGSQDAALRNIENCVADFRAWILSDRLLIHWHQESIWQLTFLAQICGCSRVHFGFYHRIDMIINSALEHSQFKQFTNVFYI